MSTKDSLGDRMKENYENRYRIYLTRRTPVIIRIDGKAFHSFTRGFAKPWDLVFKRTMWATAKTLCENIMGCQLAYVQSDEISLLLIDYKKLTTQAWFDYNLQKICSVAASKATCYFNCFFVANSLKIKEHEVDQMLGIESKIGENVVDPDIYDSKYWSALFDARAFNIPESEVCNYFIWRQQDATRNSIEMLGRCYFSQKQLHKVNNSQIQEKLMTEKGINWNDFPTFYKRGMCVKKKYYKELVVDGRPMWDYDFQIPIFTQDRAYIEDLLKPEADKE